MLTAQRSNPASSFSVNWNELDTFLAHYRDVTLPLFITPQQIVVSEKKVGQEMEKGMSMLLEEAAALVTNLLEEAVAPLLLQAHCPVKDTLLAFMAGEIDILLVIMLALEQMLPWASEMLTYQLPVLNPGNQCS